jgi:hypothetical protein
MTTAIDGLVAIVVVHAGNTPTEPAANATGEQILASTLTGGVTAMRGVELNLIDKGEMLSWEPVVAEANFTQVDPVQTDVASG